MRSFLARAAAILAVTFGAVFAAQGVALADSHDGVVVVDDVLNGNTVNVPIVDLLDLDLDDIAILSVLNED